MLFVVIRVDVPIEWLREHDHELGRLVRQKIESLPVPTVVDL